MEIVDLSGQSFGPHRFEIAGLPVADFVAVTGDKPSRWSESAPPGFIATALFVVAPDLLGQLEDRSVLHGEQTFAWLGPLPIGSKLEVSGAVTRVRERGGVAFVGFDIEVVMAGTPIASGSSMFLVSGESTATEMDERPEPTPFDKGDLSGGEASFSRDDLVKYAAATRDFNPIHWDHDTAVAAGLPGVVVHGLAQAGIALRAASRHRDGDYPLQSAKIRFRNPLLPAVPVYIREELSENVVSVSITDDTTEFLSARVDLAGE